MSLYGRKFFDFGFGNATGFYDIIERPLYEVRNGSIPVDPGVLSFTSLEECTLVLIRSSSSISQKINRASTFFLRGYLDNTVVTPIVHVLSRGLT